MKKLILAAVMMAATAAMAVESDVVGYQKITLRKGVSFFVPTFKKIGDTLKLTDIGCTQTNGAAWATSGKPQFKCNGDVSIQKTDSDGNFLTTYEYISLTSLVTTPGWYWDSNGVWQVATDVTFAEGEGMIVNVIHNYGASFTISGEVDLSPARILPQGVSFCGNFTPVDMTLGEIGCTQVDGSAWATSGKPATKSNGDVSLQKTDADGNFGTTYEYISLTSLVPTPGWYYDNAGTWVSAADVKFASGEGFIVNNTHSVGARLVLKKPISE